MEGGGLMPIAIVRVGFRTALIFPTIPMDAKGGLAAEAPSFSVDRPMALQRAI